MSMAGQPTQSAKGILLFIAPCSRNFVFITVFIETGEVAQYLSCIFNITVLYTVKFFINR